MFFFQENDFCFVVISFCIFPLKTKTNKITNPQVCFCVCIDVYRNKIFLTFSQLLSITRLLSNYSSLRFSCTRWFFFMKLLNDIHNSIACMKKYMYLICLLHNVIIFFSVRLPRRCTEYDLQSVTPACKLYMNMFNRNFKTFVLGFTADLHPINLSFNLPSRFFLPSLVKSTK